MQPWRCFLNDGISQDVCSATSALCPIRTCMDGWVDLTVELKTLTRVGSGWKKILDLWKFVWFDKVLHWPDMDKPLGWKCIRSLLWMLCSLYATFSWPDSHAPGQAMPRSNKKLLKLLANEQGQGQQMEWVYHLLYACVLFSRVASAVWRLNWLCSANWSTN